MPPSASAQGPVFDRQMWLTLGAMLTILVVAQLMLLLAVLRSSKPDTPRFSLWNAATFVALTLLLVVLTVRAEKLWAANRFQGPAYDAIQVEVVGQQYQWYFRYPGGDAAFGAVKPELVNPAGGNPLGIDRSDPQAADDFVSSTLVLPVGREVNLRVRSLDVVHGFFIPAMRVKQDAVPGSVFNVHFTPITTGTYDIVCSQVCGTGHFRMGAELRVVTLSDYAAWLKAHAAGGQR